MQEKKPAQNVSLTASDLTITSAGYAHVRDKNGAAVIELGISTSRVGMATTQATYSLHDYCIRTTVIHPASPSQIWAMLMDTTLANGFALAVRMDARKLYWRVVKLQELLQSQTEATPEAKAEKEISSTVIELGLEIIRNGDQLHFIINENEVHALTSDSIPSLKPAVAVMGIPSPSGPLVEFSNFSIEELDS